MKENKYDDPRFFEKYSHMSRSEQGSKARANGSPWPRCCQRLRASACWISAAARFPAFWRIDPPQ